MERFHRNEAQKSSRCHPGSWPHEVQSLSFPWPTPRLSLPLNYHQLDKLNIRDRSQLLPSPPPEASAFPCVAGRSRGLAISCSGRPLTLTNPSWRAEQRKSGQFFGLLLLRSLLGPAPASDGSAFGRGSLPAQLRVDSGERRNKILEPCELCPVLGVHFGACEQLDRQKSPS